MMLRRFPDTNRAHVLPVIPRHFVAYRPILLVFTLVLCALIFSGICSSIICETLLKYIPCNWYRTDLVAVAAVLTTRAKSFSRLVVAMAMVISGLVGMIVATCVRLRRFAGGKSIDRTVAGERGDFKLPPDAFCIAAR